MVRLVFSNESKTFAMKKKEKTENYSQSILLKREREVSADSFEHLRNYHSSLLTHCDSNHICAPNRHVSFWETIGGWTSKLIIVMMSWDFSRQAIPRQVLFSVCRSYLEAALLPSPLIALRVPSPPLSAFVSYAILFVDLCLLLALCISSLSPLRLFIRSASFFSVFLRIGTAACIKEHSRGTKGGGTETGVKPVFKWAP